jgi:membrane associated rhomboid family serine protease
MAGYPNPVDELKLFFRKGSALPVLIAINLGVWMLVKVIYVILFLYNHPGAEAADSLVLHFLALPASWAQLSTRPWTLVTYMFLHLDFFHILFNMLWLYWFGKIFLEYLKPRDLVTVYLAGGLAGGILYVLAFNIFPVFNQQLELSLALGASASVMAIVAAISFYVPEYSISLIFIGRVKIIYLALVLFFFDFFEIPGSNSGGHIAHIGGALFGFFWIMVHRGSFTNPFRNIFAGLFKPFWNRFNQGKNKYNSGDSNASYTRPKTDEEYNVEKAAKQKRIDAILEKISKGGYESLNKEEKEFLFSSSGKNNGEHGSR